MTSLFRDSSKTPGVGVEVSHRDYGKLSKRGAELSGAEHLIIR